MIFDLTPRIVIPDNQKRLYGALRVTLYIVFLALILSVAIQIIFPNERGYFDFRIYYGGENTIVEPRTEDGTLIEKGRVARDQPMLFNMAASGTFSRIEVMIHTESNLPSVDGSRLEVVRAYRAFLYPEADRVGFREGSLLASDGEYFIISSGAARRFASVGILKDRGYDPAQFLEVTLDELSVYNRGDDVADSSEWIEGMIFRIGETYYQLREGELISFVSDRAYRSRYREADALVREENFFDGLRISDRTIGFVDGTLLSYGESAYIVEGDILRPIDSPDTFTRKGYEWDAVIPATGEEFGMYARGKLFTIKQPHPDGTVYFSQGDSRYFLVDHGVRREIRGEHILRQYATVTPVRIEAGILAPRSCELEKGIFPKTYRCYISLMGFQDTNVGEYQFRLVPESDMTLRDMETLFIRDIDRPNARIFVLDLIRKLRNRYGGGESQ